MGNEKYRELGIGAIVTPVGDHGDRIGGRGGRIVGIVVDDDLDGWRVIWFSNRRGVFTCWESSADLQVAPLDELDLMVDVSIDHESIVEALLSYAAAAKAGAL